MTLGTLTRRLRAAELASAAVAIAAVLPLVPLWLEAVRTLVHAEETPTPEALAAYLAVRAAVASIKAAERDPSEGEAELVQASVRALCTLPLAELRTLAGSRLPVLPEFDEEKGSRR